MKIDGMTDEQKRRVIAKACGWRQLAFNLWEHPEHVACPEILVPNYLNDLNAMHEAEKVLEDELMTEYLQNLSLITHDEDHWSHAWDQVRATARQRADAFLLTLEEPK